MEEAPENRTANMSIKLLKFHTRKNAIFLPKDGKGAALGGWELPIKVVQQLRNNLAAQLWELRRYPDNVTLAEARKLDESDEERDHLQSQTILQERKRVKK